MSHELPIEHVLAHVRDTLATDDRVSELGLVVTLEPDQRDHRSEAVVVRGAVSTRARQDAVLTVTQEVLRQYDINLPARDETQVTTAGTPDREPEQL